MKKTLKDRILFFTLLIYASPHAMLCSMATAESKNKSPLAQAMQNTTAAHHFMTFFYCLYFGTPQRETGPAFPGIASLLQDISRTYFKIGTPLSQGYMSPSSSDKNFFDGILIQQRFLDAKLSTFKKIIPHIKRIQAGLKKSISRTYFNYTQVRTQEGLLYEKREQGPLLFHHLSIGGMRTTNAFQSTLQKESLLFLSKTEQIIKVLKKAHKSYFDAVLAYSTRQAQAYEHKVQHRPEKRLNQSPLQRPYQRSSGFHGYMG